jgi:hypothetical protein
MKNIDYQMEVMGLVGYAVAHLQRVEDVISACWMLYAHREHEPVEALVFEGEFTELEARNSKKVLGRFLSDIRSSGQFKVSFGRRFARFVDNRNRLVHRIFKEKAYQNLGSRRSLERLHGFVSRLINDALYFESVFDAYLGLSYRLLAQQPEYQVEGLSKLEKLMAAKEEKGDLDVLRQIMRVSKQRGPNNRLQPTRSPRRTPQG